MDPVFQPYQTYWDANRGILGRYLKITLVLAVGVLGYLVFDEKYRYLAVLAAPVIFVLAITHPRFAVYQFICMMFSNALFSESPVVMFVELSAFTLACAALLDFLLSGESPGGWPRLTLNWVLIGGALFVSAAAGYNFTLVMKPMARLVVMAVTFLSLYRLSRYFSLRHLISFFFWVGFANALIAIAPIVSSSEVERLFGFASHTLDDLMMVVLPVGLILFMWSPRGRGIGYLAASGVVFVALLATQSRFPIMFAAGFSFLGIILSLRLLKKRRRASQAGEQLSNGSLKRRTRLIFVIGILSVAAVAVAKPELFLAVWARFEILLSGEIGGTARLRVVLWMSALRAFWDHPILGIGPGNFELIHHIYPYLHLNPVQMYVQGLSAHNLVFHYLAETGLVGASVVVALFANQFRLARQSMRRMISSSQPESALVLYLIAIMFLSTAFIEGGWMWGQISFIFVFFLALISRAHERSGLSTAD